MNELEHLINVQNELGEGPAWNAQRQALYWVDIKQSRLYRYFCATRAVDCIKLVQPIMAYGFCADGRLITVCASGFAFWDEQTGSFEFINHPEADKPATRFNDGAVDPAGRFWAGTMNESDVSSPSNTLYRLDTDLSVHKVLDAVTLANGLGWSPDYSIMYFTDTGRRQIWKYNYDIATGSVHHPQVFVELPESEGFPDGMTVDAEGCVWSAIWDGGKVIRFSPTGERLLEVEIPAKRVTSCAFGGEKYDELFITTANFGLSEKDRQQQPYAGDVFRLKTDTVGMAEPQFTGCGK